MSKYFSEKEMACKHCGEYAMDEHFMELLDNIREAYGAPLIVSSGYRCKDHPIEAKKAASGAHTTGKAVDFAVDRANALKILKIALNLGVPGIGIQQKGSGRFIHLDICTTDDGFPRPTIWSY